MKKTLVLLAFLVPALSLASTLTPCAKGDLFDISTGKSCLTTIQDNSSITTTLVASLESQIKILQDQLSKYIGNNVGSMATSTSQIVPNINLYKNYEVSYLWGNKTKYAVNMGNMTINSITPYSLSESQQQVTISGSKLSDGNSNTIVYVKTATMPNCNLITSDINGFPAINTSNCWDIIPVSSNDGTTVVFSINPSLMIPDSSYDTSGNLIKSLTMILVKNYNDGTASADGFIIPVTN